MANILAILEVMQKTHINKIVEKKQEVTPLRQFKKIQFFMQCDTF